MTKNSKHSPHNLHECFFYKTVVLILVKKVTINLPKLPEKFGQTQQQILNLSKVSIHKLQGQFLMERSYILIRS